MGIDQQKKIEEGTTLQLDFSKLQKAVDVCNEIIPVAVYNIDTEEVILIAYTNRKAFDHSIKTKIATFWSTSRNELWIKGKDSGNTFELIKIAVNCEQNSMVYFVKQKNEGICHTKNSSGRARNCFYREYNIKTSQLENIDP